MKYMRIDTILWVYEQVQLRVLRLIELLQDCSAALALFYQQALALLVWQAAQSALLP